MKVLVTGGAGFIGSHVVDGLKADGHDVLVVDSLDPGVWRSVPSYLRDDVEYCFADLRTWVPDERFDDVEGIVHLAALGGVGRAATEPENVLGANVMGTVRLAGLSRSWPALRSVVLASSFSIYGSNYSYRCTACGAERDGSRSVEDLEAGRFEVLCTACGSETSIVPITEAAEPRPLEGYGSSKYMQELAWRGYEHAPVHILRFSSAYGTRLRLDDGEATIIAKLAGWVARGVRPKLYEDGLQIRDWVHVSDIVAVATKLVGDDGTPRLINVCSGVPTRLAEACEILADAAGVDCPPEIVGGFRAGDMRHCLGDPSRLRSVLGRDPVRFVDAAPSLLD